MDEKLAVLEQLDTPAITDAMDKLNLKGGLEKLSAVVPNTKIYGKAYTVRYEPCGQSKGTVGNFIDDVKPGQVVVIDNAGRTDCTVWGDIMTFVAQRKKISGTIIDGVCRYVDHIMENKYGIYTKGVYMVTGKDRVQLAAVEEPVGICGVQVAPGDIIFGDGSGVVAIPAARFDEVISIAKKIQATEEKIIAAVKVGKTLAEARKKFGYFDLQTPGK